VISIRLASPLDPDGPLICPFVGPTKSSLTEPRQLTVTRILPPPPPPAVHSSSPPNKGGARSLRFETLASVRGHTRTITAEGLGFRYDASGPWLFRNVDLRLQKDPAFRLCVMGPNGAGKSTLIKVRPRTTDMAGGNAAWRTIMMTCNLDALPPFYAKLVPMRSITCKPYHHHPLRCALQVLSERLPAVEGFVAAGPTVVETFDQSFADLPDTPTALDFLTSLGTPRQAAFMACAQVGHRARAVACGARPGVRHSGERVIADSPPTRSRSHKSQTRLSGRGPVEHQRSARRPATQPHSAPLLKTLTSPAPCSRALRYAYPGGPAR
jgi:energy-coupling factor transporter ATP-binding protein EcfA2